MDAIKLLKDDHASIEKQFKKFEKAGDRAHAQKRRIVDRIIEELSVHAAIEEQLFYPVTRATVPAVEDVALESLEEHHIVKWVLSELENLDPGDERFDAKVTVLMENVRHHVEEEESEYFPEVRSELSRKALTELGDAMADAKKTAPTRPRPRMPDEPPGNLVPGRPAGALDRQAGEAMLERVLAAVQATKDGSKAKAAAKPGKSGATKASGGAKKSGGTKGSGAGKKSGGTKASGSAKSIRKAASRAKAASSA